MRLRDREAIPEEEWRRRHKFCGGAPNLMPAAQQPPSGAYLLMWLVCSCSARLLIVKEPEERPDAQP